MTEKKPGVEELYDLKTQLCCFADTELQVSAMVEILNKAYTLGVAESKEQHAKELEEAEKRGFEAGFCHGEAIVSPKDYNPLSKQFVEDCYKKNGGGE